MLIDDLRQQLKIIEPCIATITHYWEQTKQDELFKKLYKQSLEENFWQHPNQAAISQQLQHVRILKEQYDQLMQSKKDFIELLELFESDPDELQKIASDITTFCREVTKFKINLLLNEPEDSSNCFVSINAGAGGTESQDWAHMLLRMYIRFCERNKLSVHIVDYQPADEAGIKSATLFVKGKKPFGLLKSEHGVHRLVRISPFDSNKRRHTSFASITVIAEAPDIEITIDQNDLRIDTYRASGAGGQHVNKTDSAVRITHIPSGIVVQCQNERSQLQNKATAMKMLKSKLWDKQKEEQDAQRAAGTEKKKIEWGSQIRSYVLHPYKMVKDHRTNYESPQPDLVLDGDLMPFIESYLVWNTQAAD